MSGVPGPEHREAWNRILDWGWGRGMPGDHAHFLDALFAEPDHVCPPAPPMSQEVADAWRAYIGIPRLEHYDDATARNVLHDAAAQVPPLPKCEHERVEMGSNAKYGDRVIPLMCHDCEITVKVPLNTLTIDWGSD